MKLILKVLLIRFCTILAVIFLLCLSPAFSQTYTLTCGKDKVSSPYYVKVKLSFFDNDTIRISFSEFKSDTIEGEAMIIPKVGVTWYTKFRSAGDYLIPGTRYLMAKKYLGKGSKIIIKLKRKCNECRAFIVDIT